MRGVGDGIEATHQAPVTIALDEHPAGDVQRVAGPVPAEVEVEIQPQAQARAGAGLRAYIASAATRRGGRAPLIDPSHQSAGSGIDRVRKADVRAADARPRDQDVDALQVSLAITGAGPERLQVLTGSDSRGQPGVGLNGAKPLTVRWILYLGLAGGTRPTQIDDVAVGVHGRRRAAAAEHRGAEVWRGQPRAAAGVRGSALTEPESPAATSAIRPTRVSREDIPGMI